MKRLISSVLMAAWIAFAMLQPGRADEPITGVKPQQVLYLGIEAKDVSRSVRFYTEVIGLKPVVRPGAASAQASVLQYATLSFSGVLDEAGLIIRHEDNPSIASRPVAGLKVADVSGMAARATAAGFVVVSEPHPAPRDSSLIVAVLKDPDGNLVEIMQHR
jgi:predicted enzyme related to lactoylglutathione lyase